MQGLTSNTLAILFSIFIQAIHGSNLTAIRDVVQFVNGTWVENIAVRSCGRIIVTLTNVPEVWEIDPFTRSAELIYQFPNATGALGIAEVEPDMFAVIAGTAVGAAYTGVPGTFSVWSIDFGGKNPKVKRVVAIKEAGWLNGATVVPGHNGTCSVLLADCLYGLIWKLDMTTSKYSVWADDQAFKPNSTAPVHIGINGIRLHGSAVYFTNAFAFPALGLIPVSSDGNPAGPAQTVVDSALSSYVRDDFIFDPFGNIFLATNPSNVLLRVTPSGNVTVAAGRINSTVLEGLTSAAFGRTAKDQHVLYVSTNGGVINSAAGQQGGKVVAFDTARL